MSLSTKKVEDFLKDETHMFPMFVSLLVDSEVTSVNLPIVGDFQDVFLDDIGDLPLEQEVKFAMDLLLIVRKGWA